MVILRPFLVIFWLFLVIFCQVHKHLSQNLGVNGHFEGLIVFKSQLDQKPQYKIQILPILFFFQFCKKKIENLWLINGYFTTISGHFFANYMNIFHKTEIQMVISGCLVCLNPNWIKSNDIISAKIFFFHALKMHHFRASPQKWVWTPPKEISSLIFKMNIFPILWGSHNPHNQVKYR